MKAKQRAIKCAWAIKNDMNWGNITPHLTTLLRRHWREHLKRKAIK